MSNSTGIALLSGDSEELHVRAADVLERCGLFVFDSHSCADAFPIVRALHDLDLLILAPSDDRVEALELLSLCDEWPALRVIVLVSCDPIPLRGTDLHTLSRDFRNDDLRDLVLALLGPASPSDGFEPTATAA